MLLAYFAPPGQAGRWVELLLAYLVSSLAEKPEEPEIDLALSVKLWKPMWQSGLSFLVAAPMMPE